MGINTAGQSDVSGTETFILSAINKFIGFRTTSVENGLL